MGFWQIIETIQRATIDYIPKVFFAIVILAVGYLVAWAVAEVLTKVVEGLKIRKKLEKLRLSRVLFGLSIADIIIGIIKWLIVLVALQEAVNKLEIEAASEFVQGIINYIPSALEGLLVIIAAVYLGDIVATKVKEAKTFWAGVLATLLQVAIIYFGVVMALPLFGIRNIEILVEAFRWVMVAFAVGIGGGTALAIGLGMKDVIAEIAREKKEDIRKFLGEK